MQAVLIELTQTNSLRKIKNTFAQQFKKRRISMCYKHCDSAICLFMSSNRRNAPLLLVFSFFMLDEVELNHNGEQYTIVK